MIELDVRDLECDDLSLTAPQLKDAAPRIEQSARTILDVLQRVAIELRVCMAKLLHIRL